MKVVFFFPAFSSQEATAPLGILAVSTPLLRAGYQVKIIDSTITPNFQQRVLDIHRCCRTRRSRPNTSISLSKGRASKPFSKSSSESKRASPWKGLRESDIRKTAGSYLMRRAR
jgi:hypothetical protein